MKRALKDDESYYWHERLSEVDITRLYNAND